MPTFQERFRRVDDWCSANGHPAGFPNCHENANVTPRLYGTIVLRGGVVGQDVLASTLGNPSDDRARLIAATTYAQSQGYAHGFPTYHQAGQGAGIVYGIKLLPSSMVTWQDVPVSEILSANIDPTSRPLEQWFTGAFDWAGRNGLPAAMPNGFHARYNGVWVVGVFSFTPGSAEWRDLTGDQLGYPRSYIVGPGGGPW